MLKNIDRDGSKILRINEPPDSRVERRFLMRSMDGLQGVQEPSGNHYLSLICVLLWEEDSVGLPNGPMIQKR